MKVIEGKHYVEGGPKCPHGIIKHDDGICHHTGLLPVEDWPDKVKAEWLKKNAPHVVRGDKHCPDELEISVIVGEYEFEWEVYYRDGLDIDDKRWLMASDKDFAIALTKAVIKRAEELCG